MTCKKKKWEKPPTYKKFGGKTYKLEQGTRSKRQANKIAKNSRSEGHPARVSKAKGKDGKDYYLVYTK